MSIADPAAPASDTQPDGGVGVDPVLALPLRAPRPAVPDPDPAELAVPLPFPDVGDAELFAAVAVVVARYTRDDRPAIGCRGAGADLVTVRACGVTPMSRVLHDAATSLDGPRRAPVGSGRRRSVVVRLEDTDGVLAPEPELLVDRRPDALHVRFDARLLEPGLVARMARHVVVVLDAARRDPAVTVDGIELLDDGDRALLREWGDGPPSGLTPRPVPDLVRERARERPDALAVVHRGRRITRGELDRAADAVAGRLAGRGVRRGSVVALLLPRGADVPAAMLGVHRCGAAALMLDPGAPADYLRRVVDRAGAAVVVTGQADGRFDDSTVPLARVDALAASGGPTVPPVPNRPEDAAFLVQTSGTTGEPKVVVVTHRAVAHGAVVQLDAHRIHDREVGAWTFPPQTTVSVAVVVWAFLIAGAVLHVLDDADLATPELLRDTLVAAGVTQCFVVAPLAESLVSVAWPERVALHTLLTGSDRVRRWAPRGLPFEVGNWYGTNECNIVTGPLHPWPLRVTSRTAGDDLRASPPPIGRPWPDVTTHVVDDDLRPVPPGAAGELLVGGQELARGYLDAGPTAERFVPDPYTGTPGRRLYRTGDLVRFREDGLLMHLGRIDQQIKISGRRVEVGEIEHVLLTAPVVAQAVVDARADDDETVRLVAWVVGVAPGIDRAAVRTHVGTRLPAHMVPTVLVELPDLPRNAGGKLDRSALPEPDWAAHRSGRADACAARPAADRLEEVIGSAFAEQLGCARVSPADNFFLLGGDSLAAATVARRIGRELGRDVVARHLVLHPTPAELAAELRSG